MKLTPQVKRALERATRIHHCTGAANVLEGREPPYILVCYPDDKIGDTMLFTDGPDGPIVMKLWRMASRAEYEDGQRRAGRVGASEKQCLGYWYAEAVVD